MGGDAVDALISVHLEVDPLMTVKLVTGSNLVSASSIIVRIDVDLRNIVRLDVDLRFIERLDVDSRIIVCLDVDLRISVQYGLTSICG